MTDSSHMDLPLFRDGFTARDSTPYPVQVPEIKSGAEYYFETDSGLRYQVLFAKKKE